MKKERKLMLFVSLFLLLIILNLAFISASMNLRIEGTINNQTSDLWLKVKTGATGDVDVYDLKAPTSPSDYSQFSSSVAGNSLSIDSWGSNPRTLNLTYRMSPAQTGILNLSWNTDFIDSSLYVVTFKYFGNDSTYTPANQIGSNVNMKEISSYTTTLSGNSDIYIQVNVADYVAPKGTTGTTGGSSGGGGGGGEAPSTIVVNGEDIFIGNKFMDVFVVLGSTRTRYINLFNQAEKPILVKISLGELGEKGILDTDNKNLEFEMPGRTSKTIEVNIVSPDKIGDYTGKIVLTGVARQEIAVNIEATDQELLFDAEISVPWESNILGLGSDLPAHIKLIPQAKNPRLDVKANYYIKDENGNIIHESSETFIVEGTWEEDITFPIGAKITEPGTYYVELELEYPWPNPIGVANSRYSFEVRNSADGGFSGILTNYKLILLTIGIGVFMLLLLIIIVIIRHNKRIKKKLKLRRK